MYQGVTPERNRGFQAYSTTSFDGQGLPVDKRLKSYYIMVLLGCGLLLPWNAVLTAFDYFQNLYNDPTFEFGVPISNQVTNFVLFLIMIKYGTGLSFTNRIVSMYIVYAVLLVILPPIGMLVNAGQKDLGLILTYTVFAGFGAACAVLQSSLFGFAGLLPPEYTQAIMAGQGISGVFMNVLFMICQAATEKMSSESQGEIEAWLFFGLAAVVVVACIFGYYRMVTQRFMRYHVPELGDGLTREQEEERESALYGREELPTGSAHTDVDKARPVHKSRSFNVPQEGSCEINPSREKYHSATSALPKLLQDSQDFYSLFDGQTRQSSSEGLSLGGFNGRESGRSEGRSVRAYSAPNAEDAIEGHVRQTDLTIPPKAWGEAPGDIEMPEVSVCKVLRCVWYEGLIVFYIFFVSLLIFPGFLTVTCAKGPFGNWTESWYRLVLVTMFNVADLLGRVIAPHLIKHIPNRSLWLLALARTILVPLFYWFAEEDLNWWWGPLFFTFVLGATNGLFGSICMMNGPSLVEVHEREMAGSLMGFLLMCGIIAGSTFQLGIAQMLKADGVGDCTSR